MSCQWCFLSLPALSPHVFGEPAQSSFLDYLFDHVTELVTIVSVVTAGLMLLAVSCLILLRGFLQLPRRDDAYVPEFPVAPLSDDGFS